jgi:RimJ/RimL family protein N-acetyltransferase
MALLATALLETPRLRLQLMQPDDVDALLCIFADAKVMAAFQTPPFDRTDMTQWVQRNLDHQIAHGYGLFSVILKANSVLIGDCGLELMDVDDNPFSVRRISPGTVRRR